MLIVRKPDAEAERDERVLLPPRERKPAPVRIRWPVADDCEYLDDPDSLFWRGVWMTVF